MRNLVLWGHSLRDYQQMFDLAKTDLAKSILEYNSGPTSFNAEMTTLNKSVVSIDEFFQMDLPALKNKIETDFAQHVKDIATHTGVFVWGDYGSLENLAAHRRQGLKNFFADYTAGCQAGRYRTPQMPLPYSDDQFDIALMSHGVFADESAAEFKRDMQLIRELARVAKEVRIFPLLNREAKISPSIGPAMLELQQHDIGVEVRAVPYHLQKSDNAMLRIWSTVCEL